MAMDHAEAHERIADLALDRDALSRFDDPAFVSHVRACATCRADLVAVRGVDRALRDALGDIRDAAAIQPIHPPEALRDAVLEIARREPRHAGRPAVSVRAPADRPAGWRGALPRLGLGQWATGLAAVLVVLVVGGLAGRALAPAGADPGMVAAVASLDRVLAAPDHRLVSLSGASGAAAGTVAWSSNDFVVLTSALTPLEVGQVYRCWLEWDGRYAAIGSMDFAGSTAYWAGPVGTWTDLLTDPGTRLVVTTEAAGPAGKAPSGAVLLQAALASS